MTKVVLIPNPNTRIHDSKPVPEPYVPLGLLSVASVLRVDGFDVEILDINRMAAECSYRGIPEAIMAGNPAIVGFSTMCNQYPTTVRLARLCKAIKPDVQIMFGGPQASATDRLSIEAFPFVDVIARGECELYITQVVGALANNETLHGIPGVTFRDDGTVVRAPRMPTVPDLDELPPLDYELYPYLGPLTDMPLEVGRGCPFGCTFCSTSSFWRRAQRYGSADSLVDTIRELHGRYGIKFFLFHHDHFTASRSRVLEFCDALEKVGLDIRWRCSARVDSLDEVLLSRMAMAGCSGVLLGIETGSQRMQRLIKKGLDLGRVPEVVRQAAARGMSFVASFIMGFPEETMEDLVQTILLMTELRFAGNSDEVVQLHLLSPVPGSELYRLHRSGLLLDGHFSDFTGAALGEEEQELIKSHPDIFASFYHYDTPGLDRTLLVRENYLFLNLRLFPYTLYVLWKDERFDYPRFLMDRLSMLEMPQPAWARYDEAQSVMNVPHFLEAVLRETGFGDHYVLDVLRYEAAVQGLRAGTSNESREVVSEEFRYDVEGLIDAIACEKPEQLPRSLNEDRHWLLFSGDGSPVRTTRVRPEIGRLLAG